MSTDDNEFRCHWESGRNFVRVIHRDGDRHLMTWDGKQLGPDWMTPLVGLIPVADATRSDADAHRHSEGARRAAEKFIALTI